MRDVLFTFFPGEPQRVDSAGAYQLLILRLKRFLTIDL
jgi:hypothetical protein